MAITKKYNKKTPQSFKIEGQFLKVKD
jgi:hypothetical protein